MQAVLKVRKNGMTTIPIEIRELMGIEDGDLVIVDIIERKRPGKAGAEAQAPAPEPLGG